jgi:signal transduction histidine kinase/CheY-like chemotaxis protein
MAHALNKAQLLQAFREHTKSLCYERVKVLYRLGIVLVPLFGFLDYVFAPVHLFLLFLTLRLVTSLILLLILILAYPTIGRRSPQVLGILGPPIVGASVAIMTRFLGGYTSPYYAGLNLVILGVSLVLPFSIKETAVTCGLIYGSYILPILLLDKITEPAPFLSNNFFLLGTIVIALTSSFYSQRLRFREFCSRYQLAVNNERLRLLDGERTLLFANLGSLINSSLDWRSVILHVLKLIKENFGFERAACLCLDIHRQQFTVIEEEDVGFKHRLHELSSLLGQSPRLHHALLTTDAMVFGSSDERLSALLESSQEQRLTEQSILGILQTRSLALLPLRERGETSGLLLIDYGYSHRTITPEKFQLLVNLSEPISAALEKARLFESEQKRTSQLLIIHNISRAISSILDFKAVFKEFASLLQSNFVYEHVSIYSLDDRNRLVLSALVDTSPDSKAPEDLLTDEDVNACRALKQGKTLVRVVSDEQNQLQGAFHPGTKSQVCVPFRYSAKTVGVMNIESEKYQAFAEEDLTVLETLSDYLATWVNNANLYTDIGRKAHALQTLNSIGKAISSELNINNLFELVYRQVGQVLPSEHFVIALYEKGANRLEVKFEVADGKRRFYLSSLSHDGLIGYVMQTRTPFLVKDNFETIYETVTGRTPYRVAQSWLGVPLILGDQAVGVIVLQNFRIRRVYDSDDLNFLSTIADQAAVAISNARLFREAQDRATRLAVVNEITREASLSLRVDKLFEKINTQLKRVVSFEKSSIATYDAENDTFSLINVFGENITAGFYKGMEISGRETVMKIAYETKRPYYTRSLDQIISNTSPYLITQGIQSAVSIPIISEDLCIGTLNLGSIKEDGFSDDQIDLLVTIANSLGTALKNARLYSDLERSYSELQNTQEQLVKSEKLRALGEMSAGVAHDFNNVLGAILGRAQLMKSRVDDDVIIRGLDIIEKAAIDGASTVRRLQDFTRRRIDQVFNQVDLIQVIEDTLSMTRARWEDGAHVSGIQYSVTTQFEPVLPIAGDSSELKEVFTNIIFNALDAMPNGGKIHIHVGTEGSRVFAHVTDTGRGMTEETRKRVFDPFFTTKGVKGNGLGMSVAYGIITRHKGEIEVKSEFGAGSIIKVMLPINLEVTRQDPTVDVLPHKKVRRFLVIDDETPIRDLLAELLVQQGHEVFTAATGKEGLEIFKDQIPDLVITDLGMPELSGWDVATTVKAINPATSVILMTGWGITIDKDKARDRGVDVVVAKPFQISEMQKVLNEMIELHYSEEQFFENPSSGALIPSCESAAFEGASNQEEFLPILEQAGGASATILDTEKRLFPGFGSGR